MKVYTLQLGKMKKNGQLSVYMSAMFHLKMPNHCKNIQNISGGIFLCPAVPHT